MLQWPYLRGLQAKVEAACLPEVQDEYHRKGHWHRELSHYLYLLTNVCSYSIYIYIYLFRSNKQNWISDYFIPPDIYLYIYIYLYIFHCFIGHPICEGFNFSWSSCFGRSARLSFAMGETIVIEAWQERANRLHTLEHENLSLKNWGGGTWTSWGRWCSGRRKRRRSCLANTRMRGWLVGQAKEGRGGYARQAEGEKGWMPWSTSQLPRNSHQEHLNARFVGHISFTIINERLTSIF